MTKDKWKSCQYLNKIGRVLKDGIWALGLNLLLAILVFGYYLIQEQGLFSLSYDFNSQIIPFTKSLLDTLHGDSGLWSWNIDLGSNVVTALSYYLLGSPFFWIFSWCKGEQVLYIVGLEYILKYALTGFLSYYYFRRHTEHKILALAGSVLYSFCGFQTVNLLYTIMHDAVAFFPLLLLTFEEMLEKNRRGYFALAVCVNAIVNYYCFIGEVIFLGIYFLLRYLCSDFQYYRKKIWLCMTEGLLGVLMASVLFIPAISSILKSSRVSEGIPISQFFSIGRRDLLQYYISFLYPSEMFMQRSSIYTEDWTSRSAYLPMVSVTLEIAYLLKRKKHDWLKRVLVVMTILMIVPVGNGLFSLFMTNYCRWFYMPIVFMIVASVKVMEDLKVYKVWKVSVAMLALIIVQYLGFEWWNVHKFQLILDRERYHTILIMGMLGIMILLCICVIKKKQIQQKALLISISFFAVLTTSYTCHLYQIFDGSDSFFYQDRIDAINQLEPEEGVRYLTDEDNLSMLGGFSGIHSFISTITGSIPEFWESLGLEKKIFSPIGPTGTNELLSVKYMICEQPVEEYELVETYMAGEAVYYLYQMPYSLNIGYTYDSYLDYEDFILLPKEIRALVMLKTLIVPKQAGETLQGMKKLSVSDVEKLSETDIPKLVELHQEENATDFKIEKDKFSCCISTEAEKYAFFTVPYDKGWSATVNDRRVEMIKVNGFMAIPIEAGDNQIEFTYHDSVFGIAIWISIVSLGVWLFYMYVGKNREKIWKIR